MRRSQIGNTQLISSLNNRLVLHAVRILQPTFRAEVARHTGLKPATVTSIVASLITQHLLRETADAESNHRPGRPPMMLEINADLGRILAIDLKPDSVRVATTDLLANILNHRDRSVDRDDRPEPIINAIIEMSRELLSGIGHKPLQGVGIGLPGRIDREHGVLLHSLLMPRWSNVAIADLLANALGANVRIERTRNLPAIFEKWSSPSHQSKTIAFVSIGESIELSILNHGQLYAGADGLAGNIGHTVIDINGERCACGRRGCLETMTQPRVIVDLFEKLARDRETAGAKSVTRRGEHLSPLIIHRLARDGDAVAIDVVQQVGRHIGVAVCNVVNLFAPDEIVICGTMEGAEELIIRAIEQELKDQHFDAETVIVRLANENEHHALRGAAVLIAQELFELPELRHAEMELNTESNTASA